MTRILFCIGLLLSSCSICFGFEKNQVPKIFIEYGDAFDYQCGIMISDPGTSEGEMKQVRTILPEVQKIWGDDGTALLRELTVQTGKSFKRTELSVTLVTCKAVIAVSHPTMINMKPFLKMGLDGNHPILVDTIFHELTHRFLDEHFSEILDPENKRASPLMKKYSKEDPVVLAHIHLFALQKAVYNGLKRENDWKKAEAFMRKINDPKYIRALDIVVKEGYQTLLKELN